nr:uncharacterized protein LOC113394685 [Vanessa tameamea]
MTKLIAELGVEIVVAKICELGLRIAPHKTEALWFQQWPVGWEPPRSQIIRVGDSNVQVARYMKYLGLVLDGHWSFEEHFKLLAPRIEKAVGAMHRLLPFLGGPREEVRRLYAGVVRSMALYGAPVWSHRLSCARRCKTKILSLQRRVAIRMVRGYRTISFEAATLLASFPPLDILAERDARVYGLAPFVKVAEVHPTLPVLSERLGSRSSEGLSRHGVLVSVEIDRTRGDGGLSPLRGGPRHCPAYAGGVSRVDRGQRQVLVQEIGRNLSLRAVVSAMLRRESAWDAVFSFCETVIVQKEIAERARERADPARRRRPTGRPLGLQAPLPGAE